MNLPVMQCFLWVVWLAVCIREFASGASPDICRYFPSLWWGLSGPTCLLEPVFCKGISQAFLLSVPAFRLSWAQGTINTLQKVSRTLLLLNFSYSKKEIPAQRLQFGIQRTFSESFDWSSGQTTTKRQQITLLKTDHRTVCGWVSNSVWFTASRLDAKLHRNVGRVY